MIFILIKKLAIPAALILAWFGVTTFAFVKFEQNKKSEVEHLKIIAMKNAENEEKVASNIDSNLESTITEEKDVEVTINERSNATSRSGVRVNRESVPIYYEALDLTVQDNEIEILERIVQAEAGGSGYTGMLAVANVVLNRVKSSRFPDTVTDVVFAKGQFTPTFDGRYYSVTVSDTAKQVVVDALAGSRVIGEDALYFCTPTANGKGWFETALRKIDYIAPHNFYGYKLEE